MRSPQEIASSLSLLADLMDISGENEFKIRAHRVAADICEAYNQSSEQLLAQIASPGIPKIGENLAKKILAFSRTADLEELLELKKLVPLSVLELRRVPGLGPKKVKALYKELKVDSLDALEKACQQDLLKSQKGFGEKLQLKILEGIAQLRKYQGMMRLSRAQKLFELQAALIKQNFPDAVFSSTSQLRRGCEVLNSVDFLVSNLDFKKLAKLSEESGLYLKVAIVENKIEMLTLAGERVCLYKTDPENYGQALIETTGPEDFVRWIEQKSAKKTLKTKDKEENIFLELGLSFVAPERRETENQDLWNEISATEAESLVKVSDIKGIVHCHSTYSDGADELRAMALAAKEQGFLYLGIADHSFSAKYAGGLSEERVKSQHKEIEKLNEELAPFRILKGIESDILADGSLDYDDSVLETFDFVVASVHNGFQMGQKEMTDRIVKALKNPYTSILGHPTGRLLLEREPYAVDLKEVIKIAAGEGVAVEINASPYRLDLDWRWISYALSCGAKFSIDPDSHRIAGFDDLRFGVSVARKGGLKAENIISCKDAEGFLASLR